MEVPVPRILITPGSSALTSYEKLRPSTGTTRVEANWDNPTSLVDNGSSDGSN